jgi:NADPH:quinone reductase-like Zn-dependent oxidoreductase
MDVAVSGSSLYAAAGGGTDMNAARLHAYGKIESLALDEVPTPSPGRGEILVRVHATAVTPTEIAWAPSKVTRSGAPRPLPITLGHEFSGEVAALGAGTNGLAVGGAIYGMSDWFAEGADAEYCLATPGEVAPKPRSLGHVEASVVPISALTAWQALIERAKVEPGQRVLIHGGAGGVGLFGVQLARWRGAHVITTVSPRSVDLVRSLGADQVIDYNSQRFEDVASGVDVVLDTVGGETFHRSRAILTPNGKLVTVAASSEQTPDPEIEAAFFIVEANAAQLREVAALIDAGQLRPIVDEVFPLARARDAYAHRTKSGKAVLRIVEND